MFVKRHESHSASITGTSTPPTPFSPFRSEAPQNHSHLFTTNIVLPVVLFGSGHIHPGPSHFQGCHPPSFLAHLPQPPVSKDRMGLHHLSCRPRIRLPRPGDLPMQSHSVCLGQDHSVNLHGAQGHQRGWGSPGHPRGHCHSGASGRPSLPAPAHLQKEACCLLHVQHWIIVSRTSPGSFIPGS